MTDPAREPRFHSTTVVAVRREGVVAIGADGQVTLGEHAVKHGSRKVLRLYEGRALAGFAGGAADALALLDKVEAHLREAGGDLERAAMSFAREWRTDRVLRQLQAMLVVADRTHLFLFGGTGEVLRPDDDVVGIGSGGPVAHAAALALLRHTDFSAPEIAREALRIASRLCIYTNDQIQIETLP